jgi:hypothetical protein
MHDSSRHSWAPVSMRALVAVAALAAAVVSWYPLLSRRAGAIDLGTLLLIFALFLAAFATLALLRTPRWPHAPVRVALAAATTLAILITFSMPIPPRPETWGSLIMLGTVAVVALAAEVLIPTRPRVAALLLILLAGLGCVLAYTAGAYAMSPIMGSRVKESFGPVALLASVCIVAVWHGRSLWREKSLRGHEAHSNVRWSRRAI